MGKGSPLSRHPCQSQILLPGCNGFYEIGLLLVVSSGFSLGTQIFSSSSQKPTCPNVNSFCMQCILGAMWFSFVWQLACKVKTKAFFCFSDGKLKLFAAVPKDVIFITFLGIMLGLLLLTIALLGHLLGFHIYLSKFNFTRHNSLHYKFYLAHTSEKY